MLGQIGLSKQFRPRSDCFCMFKFIVAVRTIRPEKCDICSQRYQSQPTTKKIQNTANIFLTFRNHVKIFFSENIMHNFQSAEYRKNLSIRTDRTDKTVKTLIRLLLVEQSDQGLHCLSFYMLHLHIILQRKPKLFNFRIFSILISGVPILRGFHLKKRF